MLQLPENLGAHYLDLEFSEEFLGDCDSTVRVDLPYPVHKPLKCPKLDIVNKYHHDIAAYSDCFDKAKREFQLTKHKIVGQNFKNPYASITRNLLDFYQQQRYEPLYECDYNPYYASGLLEYCSVGDDEYLIRPDSHNNLRITKLQKMRKSTKLAIDSKYDRQPVLGLSAIMQPLDLFLLLRHNCQITLLSSSDIATSEVRTSKVFNQDIVDAKLNQFNMSMLGTVYDNLKLSLFNIEDNRKLSVRRYNIESALKVDFIDSNSVAVMNQQSLKILDLRCADYTSFAPQLDKCNTLCAFKVLDDYVYVCSRHFLLRSDLRMPTVLEYCSHMMKTSPCFMDINDDFLALSSQAAADKVIFEGCPVSSLPINVPDIGDTLQECRLKKDVNLKYGLDNRLKLSTVGLKVLNQDDGLYLYAANSVGELFRQRIKKNPLVDADDDYWPVDALERWINQLPAPPKPLRLTTVVNASAPFFTLDKPVSEDKLWRYQKSNKVSRFLDRFKAKYDTKNLSDLAANFSQIWDGDSNDEEEEIDRVPEVAPLDKVSSWIEASYFE